MKGALLLIVYLTVVCRVRSGFLDYVPNFANFFGGNEEKTEIYKSDAFDKKIPYEVSMVDETFIKEAAKLTGVALSELDSCQQRVVLKLKSDCDKMNDEQLAKMAVHLLNCQSYIEGRPTYACSDEMSIRECTKHMDSDTWTSYHLMSNRARAVCYAIRQSQFRGLAEHTVNRLMDAAQDQLRTLRKVVTDQQKLHDIADTTFDTLSKGQETISKQQQDLQKAQFHGQLVIEDNIQRLVDEKKLLLETHGVLVKMTENVQSKLEQSLQQVEHQTVESKINHEELLKDLLDIQRKAKEIFDKIDESSDLLIKQNEEFKKQYNLTLSSLREVNETVHNLVSLVGGTREALEERLSWIKTALGGTDMAVEKLYIFLWHSAFMMLGMLTCAFLGVSVGTRIVVATLPPLNLILALYGENKHLDPLSLLGLIGITIVVQTLWNLSVQYSPKHALAAIKEKLTAKAMTPTKDDNGTARFTSQETSSVAENSNPRIYIKDHGTYNQTNMSDFLRSYNNHNSQQIEESEDYEYANEVTDHFDEEGYDFTPPVSRNGDCSVKSVSRSRSRTPLNLNTGRRSSCMAKTRLGTPCKLSSLPGRDFCHRHQGGDSIIG
nr:unnamed protein product [Callosobruchus analis]